MSRELELRIQRKNTAAFIAANPTSLVLFRQQKVRTKAGGYEMVTAPLPAQTVRIITQTEQSAYTQQTDGQVRLADYVLLTAWDADIRKDDTWTAPGEDGKVRTWVVGDVTRSNEYERTAPVTERGA